MGFLKAKIDLLSSEFKFVTVHVICARAILVSDGVFELRVVLCLQRLMTMPSSSLSLFIHFPMRWATSKPAIRDCTVVVVVH